MNNSVGLMLSSLFYAILSGIMDLIWLSICFYCVVTISIEKWIVTVMIIYTPGQKKSPCRNHTVSP